MRIAIWLGMPASTVHWVLVREQLSRLSWMDRPTGEVIRRKDQPPACPKCGKTDTRQLASLFNCQTPSARF